MNRKILLGMALAIALLLVGAGVFRSQEVPEPPEPPEAPGPSQVFFVNTGSAHLGVTLGEVRPEKAQELKLPAVAGAIVTNVEKDSAAAKAGLEKGDVIVEFDGVRVRSSAELRRLVRETPAGRTVAIKVIRDGQARTLSAKLEASGDRHFNITVPEIHIPSMNFPDFNFSFGPGHASLGISGDDLTSQLAQYFGVKQGKGVLVREVMVGSAAEKGGLKAGDVIVQVDSKPVGGVNELRGALNDNFTDDTRKVNLTIVRDHHEQTVTVDLTRSAAGARHTAEAARRGLCSADFPELREQAEQIRGAADQLRRELEKQKQLVQGEWQRQLRDQMRELREQLKDLNNLRTVGQESVEI
jgi:membrane-associated protease RseP (regulator of RpoE activity)